MVEPTQTTDAVRYDRWGRLTVMARAEGYVMVRRPRKSPFVLSQQEWRKLLLAPIPKGATVYPIVFPGSSGSPGIVQETFPIHA